MLDREVDIQPVGGEPAGLLSAAGDPVLVVLRCAPEYAKPSEQGTNVYFRIDRDLDAVLARVERLGGSIVVPQVAAGEFGAFAWVLDSEGNPIGLNRPG